MLTSSRILLWCLLFLTAASHHSGSQVYALRPSISTLATSKCLLLSRACAGCEERLLTPSAML